MLTTINETEDDEDPGLLQLPDLTNDLIRAEADEIMKVQESLKQAKAIRKKWVDAYNKVKAETALYKAGHKDELFKLERMRALRLSIVWLVLIIVSKVYCYGSFSKGAYVLLAFNEFAHYLIYRGLFLPTNGKHYWYASVILFVTYWLL